MNRRYRLNRFSRPRQHRPFLWLMTVLFLGLVVVFSSDFGAAESRVIDGAMPSNTNEDTVKTQVHTEDKVKAEPESSRAAPARYNLTVDEISLLRSETKVQEKMALETYLIGVVAGEMPTDFEVEALKAQAVIARTYAISVINQGGQLCDSPAHCQCYYDKETLQKNWGSKFTEKYQRCADAVAATKGQIITYKGDIAKTFFHSTCGGKTSAAAEVWGEDLPYLQSVSCSWDTAAPRYQEQVSVSISELPSLLNMKSVSVSAGTVPTVAGATGSGRVANVSYGGETIKATDFRRALSLNSTNFSFVAEGDNLVIATQGFGHGVGLCQYGANGMAAAGSDYRKIISYYYTNITLSVIN